MYRSVLVIIIASTTLFLTDCDAAPFDSSRYETFSTHEHQFGYVADSQENLEAVLSDFSKSQGYEILVRPLDTSHSQFSIVMWRPDSMIVGGTQFAADVYLFMIMPAKNNPIGDCAAAEMLLRLKSEFVSK